MEKNEIIGKDIIQPIELEKAKELFTQFENIKKSLLSRDDIQPISGKPYIKKSGWRKIKTIFNLNEEVLDSYRSVEDLQTPLTIQSKAGTTSLSRLVRWVYKVRVTAPNGTFCDAEMMADNTEPFSFNKSENVLMAMAQTRAFNRAISDLVGGGEQSFEEYNEDDAPKKQNKNVGCCVVCGESVDEHVYNYSAKNFNKVLCRSCQDKVKAK